MMSLAPIGEKTPIQEKNRIYYNKISADYNEILEQESSNEVVRNCVKQKFINTVKPGKVLDFGGGTGLDLNWLTNNQYQVVFCEPSEGMRNRAIAQHSEKGVLFLENNKVDFTNWHHEPPFSGDADAVLSNFAVINCIENIDSLFANLSGVIKPGGHLIALMLNPLHKKTWQWKLRNTIKSFYLAKPVVINVQYKTYKQIVYVYSPKEIKRASAAFFNLSSREDLFEFTLFHFIKR